MMNEQFSALVDGELDDQQADALLARMKTDPEMQHNWNHYHLIGDALRQSQHLAVRVDQAVHDRLVDEPTVLAPRARDVEYDADHFGGRWVIRTNADGAKNFKIVTAPDGASSRAQWTDWLAHDDKVFIDGFELFDGYTAIAERAEALERLLRLWQQAEDAVLLDTSELDFEQSLDAMKQIIAQKIG